MRTAWSRPSTKILPSPIWPVGAAIDFGVALLSPVTLHLGDGQPLNADLGEGVADLVEFERLDDGHDNFHWFNLPVADRASRSTEQHKQTPRRAHPARHPTQH